MCRCVCSRVSTIPMVPAMCNCPWALGWPRIDPSVCISGDVPISGRTNIPAGFTKCGGSMILAICAPGGLPHKCCSCVTRILLFIIHVVAMRSFIPRVALRGGRCLNKSIHSFVLDLSLSLGVCARYPHVQRLLAIDMIGAQIDILFDLGSFV